MRGRNAVTNIVIAGLGGQGIVTAADILTRAVFAAGHDVKQSEIHGMSQRGGSVSSDVRFGERVHSPMVPARAADFLVITESTQVGPNRHRLKAGGRLITPDAAPFLFKDDDPSGAAKAARMINVALLAVLSAHLDVPEGCWMDAIQECLPPALHEDNRRMFLHARQVERIMGELNAMSRPNQYEG
ncbi:MAG: 2-oxoacid:acceptor oxidoreductase family protein [Candidatus Hydrogenedentota bacterium]